MEKVKFISIKVKLLGIILPVICIIITVLTGLMYNVSKKVNQSNVHDLLKTSVESQSAEIEAWLNRNLTAFNVMKQALEQMEFDEYKMQDFLDTYYNYDSDFPQGLSIADADGTLYKAKPVKTVQLREADNSGNYINNGNFASDESLTDNEGWIFMTTLEGEASAQIRDNEVVIDIANEGTVDYSVQFVQPMVPLQRGGKYKVSFDAYAEADRTIKVSVTAPDREYKRYLEDTVVNLTTTKQTYTYSFTMIDYDDANGRMEFNLGAAGSTAGVQISNVSLVKIGEEQLIGEENSSTVDVTQTEWFQDGLTRVNLGFTDAYINENGQQVISACGMLRNATDRVRVLSVDLSLDRISIYVNSFVKMENAEAFLVNSENLTILASRDRELISKKLDALDSPFMQEIAKKVTQRAYDLTELEGNLVVFEEIEGTDWLLVSYVPAKIVYRDLNEIRNIMIGFGIISVLIVMVLMERIVHIVIRPVKGLTDIIKAMTEGDFTINSKNGNHDEIGVMSRCVGKFITVMRSMIMSIDQVSHTLHQQADSSKEVSGQMYRASKEQNQSMKELNETVEQLSVSVNGIAHSATTLAALVAETKVDGDGMNGKMKETVGISQKGKEVMQDVNAAMQNINDSVQQLQQAIDKVGSASEEITNITKAIGDIADETNLLSLNASIEAARAGEAGRGFTVVATEIGKLAQTSLQSVQHIDVLVLDIKKLISEVISQANNSMDNIHSSSELIGNAVRTYDNIFENIVIAGDLVQQMIQKVDQVEEVAREVAAISEEQAASSQQILASSDILVKQADSLMYNSETVAKESEELTTSAEALESQVQIFKV